MHIYYIILYICINTQQYYVLKRIGTLEKFILQGLQAHYHIVVLKLLSTALDRTISRLDAVTSDGMEQWKEVCKILQKIAKVCIYIFVYIIFTNSTWTIEGRTSASNWQAVSGPY